MNRRLLSLLLVLFLIPFSYAHARLEIPRLPDSAPISIAQLDASLKKGVEFLLENQNQDGSWGRYTQTLSDPVLCPVPSGPLAFRIGTTSIDIMALLMVAPNDPRIQKATSKATEWLIRELPRLCRPNTLVLYNVWGHSYALQALSSMAYHHRDKPQLVARYKAVAEKQLERLNIYSNLKGGWGYYEFDNITVRPSCFSMSFTTAAILASMKEAEIVFGLKPNETVRGKAINLLERLRTPEGTYLYGDHLRRQGEAMPVNRHMGSLGRTIAANYALSCYDVPYADASNIENGLDWMWARNGWLLIAKKWPIPHESYANNAGYFAFFGYYYAGLSLNKLPREKQARHATLLAKILLPQQEPKGYWWDFPMMDYHRQYGTGFALMALSQAKHCLTKQKNE